MSLERLEWHVRQLRGRIRTARDRAQANGKPRPFDIDDWCRRIVHGVGGFHDYERCEGEVWLDRDVGLVSWTLRCLANPDCAGTQQVLDAIVEKRGRHSGEATAERRRALAGCLRGPWAGTGMPEDVAQLRALLGRALVEQSCVMIDEGGACGECWVCKGRALLAGDPRPAG